MIVIMIVIVIIIVVIVIVKENVGSSGRCCWLAVGIAVIGMNYCLF
jgi:hypothetical protein